MLPKWNGSNWWPWGYGNGVDDRPFPSDRRRGETSTPGAASSPAPGGVSANHIAKWDGSSWSAFGQRDELQQRLPPWRLTVRATFTPAASSPLPLEV